MAAPSYARLLLEHWLINVEDIPTSDKDEKQEADFLASFDGIRVLIEEKTKENNPSYLRKRTAELEQGQIHARTIPLVRDNRLSGLVRDATNQLRSSADKPHDFRLMWFTSTGPDARGKFEQFIASLYGRTNIMEMNHPGLYRRCYFFRNSDFHRNADTLDGAIVAFVSGNSITAKLCLNPLSPNFQALRQSSVVRPFGTAVEDPIELESEGTALVLDTDLDRSDEGPLLAHLQAKYKLGPLQKIDLGLTSVAISLHENEP